MKMLCPQILDRYQFYFRILLQACSLYVAEVAPKERRGAMVSLSVTFTLMASVVGY